MGVLARGLKLYYRMETEAGGVTPDSSGNGFNGTVDGATLGSGAFGKGYAFDGTDDFIDCGNVVHDADNDTITIAFRMTYAAVAGGGVMTGERGDAGAGANFGYKINYDSGADTVNCSLFGRFDQASGTPTGLIAVTWGYVAWTYDKSNVVFYVDGAVLSTHAQTDAVIPSVRDLYVGALNNVGSAGSFFKGSLDEVMVFDRVLPEGELRQVMQGFLQGGM